MMPDPLIFDLADESQTQKLGTLLARHAQAEDVILLFGDLGTGKTTLARAFIRALTHPEEEVPSPTFTLVQTYDTDAVPVWHFDLYRLEKPDDIYELGFEDACCDICLIEWPERLGSLLPKKRLEVMMEIAPNSEGRTAKITPTGQWQQDLGE